MTQLQIRDVPGDLHRKLRALAANTGRSLSEYVIDELAVAVERSEELALLGSASPASVSEMVTAAPSA